MGTLGTNFVEVSIEIQTFSFKKMHLKNGSDLSSGHYVLEVTNPQNPHLYSMLWELIVNIIFDSEYYLQ